MKLKLKKKNAFIALLIIIFIIIEFVNPFKFIATRKLVSMNYTKNVSESIINYGLKSDVLKRPYSEFINQNITDKHFVVNNYDYYKDLNYYPKSNDLDLINKLIEKGYIATEIDSILKTGTIETIKEFILKDKYENILNYLSYDYAILSKLDEYIEYKELNVGSYEDAVFYINLGINYDYYTNYNEVADFSYTMLVNKYNKLTEDFTPDELVSFPDMYCTSDGCEKGNKVMIEAFAKMASDLLKEKSLHIYARSAYRTYDYQEKTFNNYLKLHGEKYALNNVAKPGFSEHQTGLCVDIRAESSNTFKGTIESQWIKENAHKYGFILRYEASKQSITGFKGEEWHYRYVGLDVAKIIKEKKITFEEYYIKYEGAKNK